MTDNGERGEQIMNPTVRIDGYPHRVVGKTRLTTASRACYGKYRFVLRRLTDGSLWTVFDSRVTSASELRKCEGSPQQ
ncbi:hypothetical protein NLM24_34335 [Nocardia zapadnayensis]|uniref:hypothetical protein n=1 Tax=Nocardia rhamnosiphila TaxID=426716 RepID=UPI002247E40C|nr:hypothetical protein [Nocardia zapadnayensis]MCX0275668.1 hypothetical protein [Nocardia zapadnayensis]